MSTQQNRTTEAMNRSEASRARLLRDHAAQFLTSADSMLRALPYLDEAVTISTENAVQDHAIRLRQRVVQRLAPQKLAQWIISSSSPTLTWSTDSTVATCVDGTQTYTTSLNPVRSPSITVQPIAVPALGSSIRRSLRSPDGRSIIIQTRQSVTVYTQPDALPAWSGQGLQNAWFDDSGRLILRTSAGSRSLPSNSTSEPLPEAPPSLATAPEITFTIDQQTDVRVWRGKPGGAEMCDPLPHSASVTTAAIDPSGRYIATLTSAAELRVWEIATALPITPPLHVSKSLKHIAWDAAHYELALWSETECQLFNW